MKSLLLLGSVLLIGTAQAQNRQMDSNNRADCDTVQKNAELCRNATSDNQRDLCRRMANFLKDCAANFDNPPPQQTNAPKTLRVTPIEVLTYRDNSRDQNQQAAMHDFMEQFTLDLHSPAKTGELTFDRDVATCTWQTANSQSSLPPINITCEAQQGVSITGQFDTENRIMVVHMETRTGITADAKIQVRVLRDN